MLEEVMSLISLVGFVGLGIAGIWILLGMIGKLVMWRLRARAAVQDDDLELLKKTILLCDLALLYKELALIRQQRIKVLQSGIGYRRSQRKVIYRHHR
jgi:hypothetical protein